MKRWFSALLERQVHPIYSALTFIVLAFLVASAQAALSGQAAKPVPYRNGNMISIGDGIVVVLDEKPGATLREELAGDGFGSTWKNVYVPIKQPVK